MLDGLRNRRFERVLRDRPAGFTSGRQPRRPAPPDAARSLLRNFSPGLDPFLDCGEKPPPRLAHARSSATLNGPRAALADADFGCGWGGGTVFLLLPPWPPTA